MTEVNLKEVDVASAVNVGLGSPQTRRTPHSTSYEIDSQKPGRILDLPELWQFRELLYFLVWRDIKVRYKQTVIGAAWAIIQPITTMIVFTVFFGQLVQVDSEGLPYPLFSFAALVPWNFFTTAVGQSADSLIGNGHLIKKIYFPRLLLPLSRVLGVGLDALIAFVVLIVLMLIYGRLPQIESLWLLPILIIVLILNSFGIGLWLSAINVRYRDIRYVVPFMLQTWLFITPVVYSSRMVDPTWQFIYSLNPMTGVVEGFRWALFHSGNFTPTMLIISCASAVILVVTGLIYFRRGEGRFADMI
jgi:lipopolysaccharide transport system permease protein